MSAQAVALLATLLGTHWLGDYTPLSTERMQLAKRAGGPLGPIAAHALVHSVLVGFAVGLVARPSVALMAAALAIEFVTHFALDAGRARLGMRVAAFADPGRNLFWYALGVDQLAHGLVLVGVAALVL